MLVFLIVFIGYQCYRMVYAPSIALASTHATGFVVWLTWRELQLHRLSVRGRRGRG